MRRATRSTALVAVLAALSLCGCKIVYDRDKAAADPSDPNNFDAKTYVAAFWDSKAVAYFDRHASALPQVLAAVAKDSDAAGKEFGHRAGGEGSPWTFVVRGAGIVESLNTASHHGEMVVKVGSAGHTTDATLQIGPVIFGTAVRDALPFIAFGDFQNQIQYAEVSRALNERASTLARAGLSPPPRVGAAVEFVGAMADPASSGGPTITVVRLRQAKA